MHDIYYTGSDLASCNGLPYNKKGCFNQKKINEVKLWIVI